MNPSPQSKLHGDAPFRHVFKGRISSSLLLQPFSLNAPCRATAVQTADEDTAERAFRESEHRETETREPSGADGVTCPSTWKL